jgi:hypothetical protein
MKGRQDRSLNIPHVSFDKKSHIFCVFDITLVCISQVSKTPVRSGYHPAQKIKPAFSSIGARFKK